MEKCLIFQIPTLHNKTIVGVLENLKKNDGAFLKCPKPLLPLQLCNLRKKMYILCIFLINKFLIIINDQYKTKCYK